MKENIVASKNPQTVTLYGRLSWPVWTHKQAVERNAKGKFPQPPENVTAEFNLLVDQAQLDKLITHLRDEFLPFTLAQFQAGEKKNALEPKQVDKLLKQLEAADWESQPPYIPIKLVPEKSAELAPDAVAMIKIKGPRQQDIEQKAIVTSEDELVVPDPDILTYPVVRPISQTVHSMYGGAYVAATLNLYAFISGTLPGYSASAGVAVFKADGERFGGGVDVDEDEIFLD